MKHNAYDIVTKTGRARLPERQEPYWRAIGERAAIGFRQRGAGSWIARWRDRSGKIKFEALGAFPDYNSAHTAATAWVAKMSAGTRRTPTRGTVRDALAAYIRHKRSIGQRASALDAGNRFRLTVARGSAFGTMPLKDVTREDVERWRNGLKKGRAPRSVNRQVRSVVAALTYAVNEGGHIGNPKAWKLTQLVDDAEAEAPSFITEAQRARLIEHSTPALAALLTGFSETGARPSELAAATVADFEPKGGTVTFRHRKGRGGKLKTRTTQLSDAGVAFFKEQAQNKLPRAPLISNDEGEHWTDQQWCGAIQRARTAANKNAKPAERIPNDVTAYSFRHSRISELLQVWGIDPLTVAKATGTSIGMIEKYYYKFISSSMKEKLNVVKRQSAN